MRRKTLIGIASVGALLIAALLLGRTWLVRDDTAPVAVEKVVEDYRGQTPAAATTKLPMGVRIPDAGVYEYATTGSEETTLLGTSRHEYPAITTIAIRATDCGFAQTWTALDKRVEEWTLCKDADALTPRRLRDVHSFYGRTDDRTYACGGGVLPLKPGDSEQRIVCATDSTTRTDRVRAVGRDAIHVGDTSVEAVHVRDRYTLQGTTDGSGTIDWWLDADTGLPIRIVTGNDSKTDTPIGKRAPYRERFDLKLRSLTPQS